MVRRVFLDASVKLKASGKLQRHLSHRVLQQVRHSHTAGRRQRQRVIGKCHRAIVKIDDAAMVLQPHDVTCRVGQRDTLFACKLLPLDKTRLGGHDAPPSSLSSSTTEPSSSVTVTRTQKKTPPSIWNRLY